MLMKPQHFYYPGEVAAAITAAADSPVAAALRVFWCLLAVASLACGKENSDLVLLFFIDWKVIVLVHLPKRHHALLIPPVVVWSRIAISRRDANMLR